LLREYHGSLPARQKKMEVLAISDGGGMHRQNHPPEQAWYVYLLECADKTLYCGIARDPATRLEQHNGSLPGGARYTASRRPVRLLASRACGNKSEALKLELAVKTRPRAEKLSFMVSW
jgi:putative endonuclease